MREEKDIMIDIETLDTRATSLILSVGFVAFDPRGEESFDQLLARTRYDVVYLKSQINATFSTDTLKYWLDRSEELKLLLDCDHAQNIDGVLDRLNNACALHRPKRIWANSPTFDLAILRHHYNQSPNVSGPAWDFWKERDLRTLLDVAQVNKKEIIPAGFVAHHADHDAAYQAMLVQIAYAKLGA